MITGRMVLKTAAILAVMACITLVFMKYVLDKDISRTTLYSTFLSAFISNFIYLLTK